MPQNAAKALRLMIELDSTSTMDHGRRALPGLLLAIFLCYAKYSDDSVTLCGNLCFSSPRMMVQQSRGWLGVMAAAGQDSKSPMQLSDLKCSLQLKCRHKLATFLSLRIG